MQSPLSLSVVLVVFVALVPGSQAAFKHNGCSGQPVAQSLSRPRRRSTSSYPANSSQTVGELLRTHALTHKYIYYWLNKTAMDNPERVKVILIGSSFEKRPLSVVKLTVDSNPNPNKKAIWLDCGIHAREWISTAFCLWFVQYSITYYKQNQDITQILDNMDIYVLPVMNPDGYKYTWTTDRMWRKNRSVRDDSSCTGVDLNRNFDANWCKIYCGQFPESEPESGAVAGFLRRHKNSVKLYVSIHSYSQMLLFPYSYTQELAANHNDLLEMAKEASYKIRRYYRNNYKYGAGAKTIYLAPGGSDDWAYNLGIKYSFTFELQDQGIYGFLLPPSLIPKACNEALIAFKTIALRVIEKTQAEQ
ncbi:hypothetical protein CRUP_009068 [Coryphaenoides rupestris]|nr:hypothetical protein CRUP_009068 [Coryphaenoides rupestris]